MQINVIVYYFKNKENDDVCCTAQLIGDPVSHW